MRKIGAALLLAVLFGGALRAEPLRVFAAASLGGALDEAAALWQEQGGVPVLTVYASSALLARQIAAGAPADIFISANVDWMDFLEDQGLLAPDTRLDLLGNELVLIGPAAGQAEVGTEIGTEIGTVGKFDLLATLGDGRLAIGLTQSVPAGQYGRAAFENLGLWPALQDRLAETDNVRAALAFVAQGAAPLGVVYYSDALASDAVQVVARFGHEHHPVITYPAAIVADSSAMASAAALLEFLAGPEAAVVFASHGLVPLNVPQ